MKTVILCKSYHHKNTLKIAEEIARVLGAEILDAGSASRRDFASAGMIGFGSGVYAGRFHRDLISAAESLPVSGNRKAFIFSTSGIGKNIVFNRAHSHFKKILEKKNCGLAGEFECRGFDTFGILRLFGGMNKGRPSKEDIKKARLFAERIKKAHLE